VMVVDYCVGDTLLLTNQPTVNQVKSLADLVAGVHQLPYQVPVHNACLPHPTLVEYQSPYQRLSHYWQLCCHRNSEFGLQHQLVMTELLNQLKALSCKQLCLIHGDINRGNIINGARQLWLIDWEFSALDDPYIDLASVLVEFRLAPAQRQLFFNQYETRALPIDLARLEQFEAYYCALCWLWFKLQPDDTAESGGGEYYFHLFTLHWQNAKF